MLATTLRRSPTRGIRHLAGMAMHHGDAPVRTWSDTEACPRGCWLGCSAVSANDALVDILREYLRAWEGSDVAAMQRLVASGFTHEVNGRLEDRDGLLARVADADAVIGERRFELDAVVADGTQVACRCRLIGRHTGAMPLGPPLRGLLGVEQIEPTGRDISMSGMIVATIQDGQITSGYGEWDRLGLLTQLVEPSSSV
jgi:predicted ester cyclase